MFFKPVGWKKHLPSVKNQMYGCFSAVSQIQYSGLKLLTSICKELTVTSTPLKPTYVTVAPFIIKQESASNTTEVLNPQPTGQIYPTRLPKGLAIWVEEKGEWWQLTLPLLIHHQISKLCGSDDIALFTESCLHAQGGWDGGVWSYVHKVQAGVAVSNPAHGGLGLGQWTRYHKEPQPPNWALDPCRLHQAHGVNPTCEPISHQFSGPWSEKAKYVQYMICWVG